MPRYRTVLAALLAGCTLAACATDEEKLIDRRHRLGAMLDELYESYSGLDAADESAGEPRREGGVVGRFLARVDREHFDEYCLALGRGERPFTFSEKLETFMKSRKSVRTCRRAAELELSIQELERETAAR